MNDDEEDCYSGPFCMHWHTCGDCHLCDVVCTRCGHPRHEHAWSRNDEQQGTLHKCEECGNCDNFEVSP